MKKTSANSTRRLATLTVIATVASSLAVFQLHAESSEKDVSDPSSEEKREGRPSLRRILESWIPGGDSEDEEDQSGENEDAAGGLPSTMEGGAYSPAEVLPKEYQSMALPWRPPEFSGQTGALGWTEKAFDVPEGMKARVEFWRDIYSKYTTDQGVLHDSLHIHIVYTPVDFNPIMKNPLMTLGQKARARERLVDEKRREIVERLKRLHGRTSSEGLSGEDLRVWKMYEGIKDPAKFLEAAEKGRVRFQLGQRDKFILGIYYSGRYLKTMEKIFREEGLPIELTRLPFVESSFNINARSRVGASGIWQFMPRTARPLMRVGKEVDERNDPLKATLASARVLKQNYTMLQTWPLAVTGYNHGPYGVRGIVNKLGTRDISEIIRRYSSKTFGFASENFYACFLAALEVERNARRYFGDVKWSTEIDSHELKVTRPVPFKSVIEFFDGNTNLASLLNPHVTSRVRAGQAMIPKGTFMRVPSSRGKIADDFMRGKIPPSQLVAALRSAPLPKATPVPAVLTATTKSVIGEEPATRSSLEKISAAAAAVLPVLGGKQMEASASAASGTSVATVPVPGTGSPPPNALAAADPAPTPEDDSTASEIVAEAPIAIKTRKHKVRRGENLIAISKKYKVGVSAIKKANGLDQSKGGKRGLIRAGQVLVIPPETGSDQ